MEEYYYKVKNGFCIIIGFHGGLYNLYFISKYYNDVLGHFLTLSKAREELKNFCGGEIPKLTQKNFNYEV